MKVEGVLDVSRQGYLVTTAFSSLNPGIGGIDCVIAVAGVSQVVLTRLNLARGSCQLAGSPQAIARVTGRTSPGDPLKYWGEERPRPARVDTPGHKRCPNLASIKQRTSHNKNNYSLGLSLASFCSFTDGVRC